MHLVFVYGSLMAGFGNHRLLCGSRFVCEAKTAPKFTLVSLGSFPGMVRGGYSQVHGEVYEVDDQTLRQLDCLEGHPSFYRREQVRLDTNIGGVEAYILQSDVAAYDVVTSGDWRQFYESRYGRRSGVFGNSAANCPGDVFDSVQRVQERR